MDEAFANVYSTTMSVQNILPQLDRRIVAVIIGVIATLLAGLLDFGQYQSFLFLIGSVFVPLFAVAAVDFFLVSRQRWDVSDSLPAPSGTGDRLGLRVRRLPAGLPGTVPGWADFWAWLEGASDFLRPAGWVHRWRP